MAEIFDRDTLLDLTVNAIPLGIILFFVVAFVLIDPFDDLDFYGRVLQMGLLVVPFVALAILTYVSGKAIAGDEKRAEVYFQGQATMEGAQTRHEAEAEMEGDDSHPAEADDADDIDAADGAATEREAADAEDHAGAEETADER